MKRQIVALMVELLLVVSASAFELNHTTINQPAVRTDDAAAAVGTKLLLASYAGSSGTVDIFDTSTQGWTTAAITPARYDIGVTTIGTVAYFAGGHKPNNQLTNYDDIDIYDAGTGLWSKMHLSVARAGVGATTVGSKIVFAGGWTQNGYNTKLVDIYDTITHQWATATLASPGGPTIAVSVGSTALFHSNNGTLVDIYDSSTGQWSSTNLSHWRDAMAATVVGHKAIFAGGWDNVSSKVVDIYDADTHQWSQAALSQARGSLAATTVGNLALFGGGLASVNPTTLSDVVDVYDVSTGLWSITHLAYARRDLVATTVGNQAFFAGGGNSTVVDVFTVPEPSTPILLAAGAFGFLGWAWRRRHTA